MSHFACLASSVLVGIVLCPLACGSDFGTAADPGSGGSGTGGSAAGSAGASNAGTSSGIDAATAGSAGQASGGSAGRPGAGGTGGASAGAAGMAVDSGPPCSDDDDDGVSTCDGDCDDSEPLSFPGNPEVCGDGIDNDCQAGTDDICQGLGTFVSVTAGNDANPGTQAAPVQTIAQGIARAQQIGNDVDVYVAQGHYSEKVTLTEGVSLFGGHDCAALPCSWVRDPGAYDSAILNPDFQGLLIPAGVTRATALDGFRIMGKSGASSDRAGTSAVRVVDSSPVISKNRIFGGEAMAGDWQTGRSNGVFVDAPSGDPKGPLLVGNDISGGKSSAAQGSNAVLIDAADPARPGRAVAEIRGNVLVGGEGRQSRGLAAWRSGPDTLIAMNNISAGMSNSGGSWGIEIGSEGTIENNYINAVTSRAGKCNNPWNWCGGILSESSTTTIRNNVVFGVDSTRSAAVALIEAEQAAGVVELNSNYLNGASPSGSSATTAALVLRPGVGTNVVIGKVWNNVLLAITGSPRYGAFEEQHPNDAAKVVHPESFENNAIWLGGPAGATGGALYRYRDANASSSLVTEDAINQHPVLLAAANIETDPAIDYTFHLIPGSRCIDSGNPAVAPREDFEGDARPMGNAPDIGPDEAE